MRGRRVGIAGICRVGSTPLVPEQIPVPDQKVIVSTKLDVETVFY